jgi:hypothetical protein
MRTQKNNHQNHDSNKFIEISRHIVFKFLSVFIAVDLFAFLIIKGLYPFIPFAVIFAVWVYYQISMKITINRNDDYAKLTTCFSVKTVRFIANIETNILTLGVKINSNSGSFIKLNFISDFKNVKEYTHSLND